MSVRAITADYEFEAKDRQAVYGDDVLVHVNWENNLLFVAAACFRAPKAMTWADFKAQMIDPWASADPDYDPATPSDWRVNGTPFTPDPDATLESTGVGHKGLFKFRA